MTDRKRRHGDRKDGYLVRDLDPIHYITPIIYPSRCDNEAYISETIDLTSLIEFIKTKNETETQFDYTLFHCIVAALIKTITLRPKMNRFIANDNVYQRYKVSASFVVKKQFSDKGEEGLAFITADDDTTLETVHDAIRDKVMSIRSGGSNTTADTMNILTKMPRFLSHMLIHFLMFLDRHGRAPAPLTREDPYYATVILSNLGSIKLHCGYHHLTNWGTTSVFCIIGEKELRPVYNANGVVEMHEMLDLGLTIDERLADGYYYAKTLRLLRKLLENPELLEIPAAQEIDY